MKKLLFSFLTVAAFFFCPLSLEVQGQETDPPAATAPEYVTQADINSTAIFRVDNLWILIAAALVFLMHLGFSTLETGLTRQKNAVNVLYKNVFIICLGIISYYWWGYTAMYASYGLENPGKWLIPDIINLGAPVDYSDETSFTSAFGDYTLWSDYIFQAMFAATAATIVSGAVAERIKLPSFMVFVTLLVTFAYPITGSWKWGEGWLHDNGFYDFAGSTLVHAVGGFAALACVMILGPRKGKYQKDGSMRPIPGHNLSLATIGVFLLWLGWFGFNGGSVLSADPARVSFVFVTTALAAAAGGVVSMLVSWLALKKPDLSMALNGVLAGLVGITAGADVINPGNAIIVGGIAGIIVCFSIIFFDRIMIDDPVGAISVHGVCGIWGTVAVGIFSTNADHSLLWQIIGTVSISAFVFAFSLIVFAVIKAVMGVRISDEDEFEGLDITEHGNEAYPNFQIRTD